jgi:hypothetical protein
MANNNTAEIGVARAAITGAIFLLPATGATLPTNATATITGGTNLGFIGDEGITPTRTVETEDTKDMNGATVYTAQTDFVREYSATFLQVDNVDLKKAIFGDLNVTTTAGSPTAGARITVQDKGEPAPRRPIVVHTTSPGTTATGRTHREVVPVAQVTSVEYGPYVGTAVRSYTLTFKAYADSNGTYVYEYDDDGVVVP